MLLKLSNSSVGGNSHVWQSENLLLSIANLLLSIAKPLKKLFEGDHFCALVDL